MHELGTLKLVPSIRLGCWKSEVARSTTGNQAKIPTTSSTRRHFENGCTNKRIKQHPNTCKLCSFIAKSSRGLNIHTKKAHGRLDDNKNEAIAEDSDVNKNDVNLCLGCKKTFSSKSGLPRHTKTCQPDSMSQNEYKCSTCQASYAYKKI